MAEHSLPGSPPVPLILRRSGRARRITLRISRLDGRVTLTLPRGVAEAEALDFARSKETWIRDHLDDRPVDCAVGIGGTLPVEGVLLPVVAVPGRRVRIEDGRLGVPGGAAGTRLQAWLKELARDRLTAAADRYAAALGKPYVQITLRDTRSRWGSCTSDGRLMFSWRLIMAPPRVLDYVAAHEVAHLREMNHSSAFWTLVERIHGPFAEPRAWLRREGETLHRFRF